MNVQYTSRHEPLEPELREFCQARFKALSKLMSFATDVDVITSLERDRHKAEIHVMAKGGGLMVAEEGPDLAGSLHRAFEHLEKKLKKERDKFREKKRRGSRERKELASPVEPGVPAEPERRWIRASFFSAKPMTVAEGLTQFELKKKEVLMFRREETEAWVVLFRRKDGRVGLVEPE
jgi:putative sigma-54 modulation protein